ncbi:MAG: hypothetical protein PHC61_03345 [Chitinivibrionales bacterium]|nr:hypothetical protein [Chitinivibrionales bacterium]
MNSKNTATIIVMVLIVLIVVVGSYIGIKNQKQATTSPPSENTTEYKNTKYGFSIDYLTKPELQYPINGVLETGNFHILDNSNNPFNIVYDFYAIVLVPIQNLSQFLQPNQVADFRDSVLEIRVDNSLPSCTAAAYVTQLSNGLNTAPAANTVTIGGNPFEHIDQSGAGAGNFYDDQVYVGKVNNNCFVFETINHYVNCGNYDPGVCVNINSGFINSQVNAIFSTIKFFTPEQ